MSRHRRLLRTLAVGQLLIAAFLWEADRGIAVIFILIAIALFAEPHTAVYPRYRRRSRRLPRTPSKSP